MKTGQKAIQTAFVAALGVYDKARSALRVAVESAVKAGYEASDMVKWGVKAGFEEKHVRGVVSAVLLANGVRRREHGKQGPAVPQEAIIMAQLAVNNYGDKAAKYLLAAYRTVKEQSKQAKAA